MAAAPFLLFECVDRRACRCDLCEFLLEHGGEFGFRRLHAFDALFVELQSFENGVLDFVGHCGNPHGVSAMSKLEEIGMSVKREVPVVRNGLLHDGPDFDPGIDCSVMESMTKQSFAEECDINNIMRKYETTGVVDHVAAKPPQFGDFMSAYTFQESMNAVIDAENMFAQLPARIRDRFGNDPEQLLRFLEDDKNRAEAIELGIVAPPPADPPPQKVEVVNQPAGDTPPPQPKGA